jgi:hypothetical protein
LKFNFLVKIALLFLASVANAVSAQIITLTCEWRGGEAAYTTEITVDLVTRTATRDGRAFYEVLKSTDGGFWLSIIDALPGHFEFQVIERSLVGGRWTDVVIGSNGQPLNVTGGYCVENG